MKKYLLSIAALLLGLLAHSQEADDLGNYAEVSIIPRLDLNPVFGSESEFTLGNSSLYTLFEGSASEHFSWTLANHWVSAPSWSAIGEETAALYKGLGFSDTNNLIDLMYVDLTFGNWTFTLGKQSITTGGHEYDDYDWLVYPQLASPLWNDLACYQWGGMVTFTTPSELSSFSLQMTSSPFGERPFGSGLWSYSAQWGGEYGWYSPLWSVSAIGKAPGEYAWLVSLGNQFYLGDWTLTLDWSNTSGMTGNYDDFMGGCLFHGRLSYAPSERWDFSLRGNYVVTPKTALFANWWTAGTVVEFFPLQDSDALRLHAFAEYDSLNECFQLCAGILYNFNLKLW
ncbi:MAG: hypothetical protein K5849_05865 [Bacteroidales bacterium]|nr:hypothetical protein [Bacteroidales bacterium]